MALVVADRVQETTTTTGTGTYTLAGSKAGFQSFAAVGDGNTTYYACTDGTDYEVGIGTFTLSGTTLARTTIIESSNSDAAVNWGAGSKDIFVTLPSSKALVKDSGDDFVLADGEKLRFGNGPDLSIYHNGTESIIHDHGTGPLRIRTPQFIVSNFGATETQIQTNQDAGVKLFYDNSEVFETVSGGIDVTGNIAVSGTVDGVDIATNIPSSLGTAGQVLTVNADATAGEWADAAGGGGGGASAFTGLSDTPASLGTAGQILQVNSGASALEFIDAGGFSKGTVTGNTIDLSTGNIFEYQPSANSTLTFSNAPTVHEFILKVTGNSAGSGYDISSPTLLDQFDPSEASNPNAFAFNNDGSKFFVGQSGNIYEYSTSNYALAGATYVGSVSVGQSETLIEDIFFVDGSNLQVVGTNTDTIHQYTIDNGSYDVSGGITYANKELVLTTSVHADLISPRGFAYNSDGSKLFIVGSSSRDIFMVTLGTNYDPSSADAFVSTNRFDLNANHFGETNPMAVRFNDDGSSIFIAGFTQEKVMEGSYSSGNEYSIDPNDITYNSATDIFNPSEITDIRAMVFVNDGVNMVLSQGTGSNLYRYRTAAPAYTITYPAAVKWDGGSAPPVPEKDKIDTYYFYTVDGGTTYYATQLGDNHA